MPDFFGIANAYKDMVAGGPTSPRTGSDELERTKGAAASAARARKDAAEQAAASQAVWQQFLNGPAATPASSSANYAALSPRTRVGSPRNEGWGQQSPGGTVEANKRIVMEMAQQRGWTDPNVLAALDRLVMKESGYKNTAQNPNSTAFGMFQFLDSTWKPYGAKTADPRTQAQYGLEYIARRYGDPLKALQFHLANNWY